MGNVISQGKGKRDDRPQLRMVHGRGLNAMSDAYRLPADVTEMDRLRLQHRMWRLLIGGLYPAEVAGTVEQLLSASDRGQPAILDLGSGSGIWASEMAAAYPHANIVGFDLIENTAATFPSNCRFITGDLTKGFTSDGPVPGLPPQFKSAFDIVHARCILGHLEDPTRALELITDCLKPGGLLLLGDGSSYVYDAAHARLPPAREGADNTGCSWFARWGAEVRARLPAGLDTPFAARVAWLRGCGTYEEAECREYYAPVGWAGERIERGEELGAIMKRNTLEWVHGFRPMMLNAGHAPEVVDNWIGRVEQELEAPQNIRLYTQWPAAWALKKKP